VQRVRAGDASRGEGPAGTPFLSVVAPIYNEERHVRACAEALLAQDYPKDRFEILMVDNNSTDRSAEIVASIPGIELLSEPVQGDFAARNLGISRARGEILAFTDSDTAPTKDWLRRIADTFEDPDVGVIVGHLAFNGTSPLLALLESYEADKASFIFEGSDPGVYFGYTCNLAARRSLFDRLGPFANLQRNADVVFVRQAVDAFGTDVAAYAPAVSVVRLEITSVGDYLRKQIVYGRDYPRYAELASARVLGMRERLQIFRRVLRGRSHAAGEAVALLAVLTVGALCYDGSRWWSSRSGGETSK
jgi:glycosyltransferase involved in cell wall biosynthesis